MPSVAPAWLKRFASFLPFALPFYLVRFQVGPIPSTLLELFILILFVSFLLFRRSAGMSDGWRRLGPWQRPMIAWLIVTLIAVFISPSLRTGFGLWRAYVLEPLLVLVMFADLFRDEEDLRPLQRNLCLTVIILAAWGVGQFLTGWGIPSPWNVAIIAGRRATGPFPYPNALALFAAPVGAWAGALWLRDRRRLLLLVTWVAAFASCIVAKSEGGMFALGLTSVVSLLLFRPTRRYCLVGLTVGTLAVALISPIRQTVLREVTFQGWSGKVRVTMWKETWQMLRDHLLFGAGFGGYPKVFAPYHHAMYIEIFQYPHTLLFNFWSETGLLGVVVFAWIVGTWFRVARRRQDGWVLLAPLVAMLVHGLVDVPYFKNDLAIEFWLFALFSLSPGVIPLKKGIQLSDG